MSIEIKVPVLPESVADATVATWYKKVGEFVKRDEKLVDIETDKVVLEVVAPEDGSLEKIIKNEGETVKAEEVIAQFQAGEGKDQKTEEGKANQAKEAKEEKGDKASQANEAKEAKQEPAKTGDENKVLSPALRRMISENDLKPEEIKGSGEKGEITKEDIQAALDKKQGKKEQTEKQPPQKATPAPQTESKTEPKSKSDTESKSQAEKKVEQKISEPGERKEKRVPMTRLRAKIAERLIQAQQQAAILTTFNEINMEPVIHLRKKYKETFEKTYGVRLGFMSFFTLAVVEALKQFPIINASVDGNDIVYHGYFDIGIAVSSPRGLVALLFCASLKYRFVEDSKWEWT